MIERVLARLIRLTPGDFQERFADDFMATHRARSAAVGGGAPRLRFGLSEVAGAVVLVVRLRAGVGRGEGRRGGATMVESMGQDVRYAARTLMRNPGFTLVATVVIALGIGANTAIFSAVNAFFFRPLPFSDADRLVMLYETNPEFGWVDETAAPANMLDWDEQVEAFASVSGYSDFVNEFTLLGEGEPAVVSGASVMGNFFETLGARAALGRTFRMDETWAGDNRVVVLSHDLWMNRFGGAPGVVGRTITVSGAQAEVIGVMPQGFRFPTARTQLWVTTGWAPGSRDQVWFRRAHFIRAFARLAPDVTPAEADAQLQVVVERLQADYPETNAVMGAGLTPIRDFLVKDVRTPLLVLLGAVALLLLLACTNVANLMLVRARDRGREMALRHALGAGRGRVARQMLTESALVALLGAGVGLVLGWVGVRVVGATFPLGIDGATSLSLDLRVVLFTAGVAGVSAVLFGSAPVFWTLAGEPEGALREGGRGASQGRRGLRAVNLLVAAEVALALLLVVGAGLMVRTSWLLQSVDPGFSTEGVLGVRFTVPQARYQERDDVLAFYENFARTLEGRAGVRRVGLVGGLPLDGTGWTSQFQAEGWPPERVGLEISHRRADGAYFEAVETPLVRGRLFTSSDGPESPSVVLINETFAREHFPGEDPVGQRIAFDRAATRESEWHEIIGIVADQRQVSPGVPARAEVFENALQEWGRDNWIVLRGDGGTDALIASVREVLAEVDPLIPIGQVRPFREVWRASMAREGFVLTLLMAFGVVALILAAVGVYGVTSQAARRRTHEIGIRMALGADAPVVIRLMVREGLWVVGTGLAAGLVLVLASTRAMASLLYGVAPTDPWTLVTVMILLGGVAVLACFLPARRATTVDPVQSLRGE